MSNEFGMLRNKLVQMAGHQHKKNKGCYSALEDNTCSNDNINLAINSCKNRITAS